MEIILGSLAAWGFIMLLWTLGGVVLMPAARRKDVAITVLFHGDLFHSGPRRSLKAILWLRAMGAIRWDVVVIRPERDVQGACTLSEDGGIAQVSVSDLKAWLVERYGDKYGADFDSGHGGGRPI